MQGYKEKGLTQFQREQPTKQQDLQHLTHTPQQTNTKAGIHANFYD